MGTMKPAPPKKKKKTKHRITHRAPSPESLRKYDQAADRLLEHAAAVFDESANLDTAVRDSMAEGLSHIVYAAYDCRAIAKGLTSDDWNQYCAAMTAQWFRIRGFVEWFCQAAACGFRADPPRSLTPHVVKRRPAK